MPPAKNTLKKLRDQEREARRSIILDAAVDLFARKSFNQVSMRDIAKQAGMSPASIYRYFEDQDHLFVEALFREATAIAGNLQKRIESGQQVGLEEIAVGFVEYLLDHEAFFRMMTHFMVDGGISQAALARFNETERRLLDAFEERFKSLEIAENPRLLAHAFFSALNGVLITYCNYPGRSPQEIRRHMTRLATLLAHTFEQTGRD
jgi:AcrR family transcriptional regulator